MQRDEMAGDATLIERGEELRREMQAGRGGCHRAILAGVDGLVIVRIGLVGRALAGDIGRQRQLAEPGDLLVEDRTGEGEAQLDLAALAFCRDLGMQGAKLAGIRGGFRAEDNGLARAPASWRDGRRRASDRRLRACAA